MWLLKRSHKHIAQDTLSEYLDSRLQGRYLERVEQQLADCDACRRDLAELRATVNLLQQLPMEAPRRSFVMSAPPLESSAPPRTRPSLFLRAPNWVYAGAASFAALALAVTISVDATGGLSSDSISRDAALSAAAPTAASEQVTITSEAPLRFGTGGGLEAESAARAEDAPGGDGEDATAPTSMAAAAAPPTGDSAQGETAAEVAAGLATESIAQAAAAPEVPPAPEAAAAPEIAAASEPEPAPEMAAAAGGATDPPATPVPFGTTAPALAPASEAGQAETAGAPGTDTAAALPADAAATATAAVDGGTTAVPGPGMGPGPAVAVEEAAESPATIPETAAPERSEDGGGDTSIWWRVLEAGAGTLAVVFLAGLALRWRVGRRDLL